MTRHHRSPTGLTGASKRWPRRVCFALVVILLFAWQARPSGLALAAADTSVQWDTSSVREVYNPGGDIYTYAPSVIVAGNTEHIWTCHNRDSGVIRDHVYYTKRVNGSIVSSQPVLEPSASGWDSFHVCDTSVLRSNVSYNGTSYAYVMFYLGTDSCCYRNLIGVAFAQTIEGPWVKYPSPIVTYADYNSSANYWGVGQQTATSVDGQGRILLFYRQTDSAGTQSYVREVNLGNMANPFFGAPRALPTAGLAASGGFASAYINFDIAYDPSRARFYAVGWQDPGPATNPNYIEERLHLFSIDDASVWGGGGAWHYEGTIDPGLTNSPRNHNAGIKRTEYGMLPDATRIDVIYTDSCAPGSYVGCSGIPEWTYDLWEVSGALVTNATPLTNATFRLTAKHSGKVLDVSGCSMVDGGNVYQWTWTNNDCQKWLFERQPDGSYRLTAKHSGKVLDVSGCSMVDGGNVYQWTWTNNDCQKWWIDRQNDGSYRLTAKHSGKVLDVSGCSLVDGGNVYQWTWTNNDCQKWWIDPSS